MRACKSVELFIAGVVAMMIGTLVQAQQEMIADQDLLNLLEKVNQGPANTPAKAEPATPVSRTVETLAVVDERAAESNEVAEIEAVPAEIEEVPLEIEEVPLEIEAVPAEIEAVPLELAPSLIDDLSMATMDDAMASTMGNLISVRYRGSLEEAINLFAQLANANIIVPELTDAAPISVNLKNVEWRPALQSILDTYDYELYQRVSGSNVYSVRRRPVGAPEAQVVETFVLKYATVANVASLIRELLPESAKVSEFASRNMIVVKSTESSLGEVRAVLETIDRVRQQVFIESKFMELTDDAQKDLGIDWSVLQAYSAGTKGPIQRSYTRNDSNTRTDTTFTDALGRPYAEGSSFVDGNTLDGNFPIFEGLTPSVKDVTTKSTTEILTSVLSADEFRLVLSALEQNKGVNVVSNPKIIVANEEKANISIIRKEPNLKQERQQALNDTPDTITFSLDPETPFFDFGIKLEVTPSINTSSNITVQINPSLTRKFGDKQAGENNTYPIIDEKSIKTIFSLASGQTAAIGGLTQVTESQEERKVPLLGSIPFIGRLFSWKQTIHGQEETIIFVTVGLANTQDIDAETGMPGDAELARRQVIQDRNSRKLRDQGRQYYEAGEDDKLGDMMQVMQLKEQERLNRREREQQKETGKSVTLTDEEREIAAMK